MCEGKSFPDRLLGILRAKRANTPGSDIVVGLADHIPKLLQSALTSLQRVDLHAAHSGSLKTTASRIPSGRDFVNPEALGETEVDADVLAWLDV